MGRCFPKVVLSMRAQVRVQMVISKRSTQPRTDMVLWSERAGQKESIDTVLEKGGMKKDCQ